MSKKLPDTGVITNELKSASLFFSQAKADHLPPPEAKPPEPEERISVRSENRTEFRAPQLPVKRPARRYSFEFYDDQIVLLKQLKHEAEMRGEKVNLSDIARRAIDEYLERITGRNSERKTERLEDDVGGQ